MPNTTTVTITCQQCGKEATKRTQAKTPLYCSHACANKARVPEGRRLTQYACDWCNKTFFRYPGQRRKPNKFCSMACSLAWQRNKRSTVGNVDIERVYHRRPKRPETDIYLVTTDDGKKLVNGPIGESTL